ncbi:MAG: rhodanese-like domain-containing protein [Chitinophagales bacterium]
MQKKHINLQYKAFLKRYNNNANAILLDVRTLHEYENAHLPSATNIDIKSSDFLEEIALLDKQKSYFIYCSKGIRSMNACIVMQKMGFLKLYNLKGGLKPV